MSMVGSRSPADALIPFDGLLDCAGDVRGDHVSIVGDAWFCC
jgi:hypothetical protein